jgi:hypothetical protein
MDPVFRILMAVAALVVTVLGARSVRRGRSSRAHEPPGPEAGGTEDRSRAPSASDVGSRVRRRARLELRPLDQEARDEFARSWRDIRARGVNEPAEAVRDADRLLTEVLRKRGYPIEDVERWADEISRDHPDIVNAYLAARTASLTNDQGEASSDELYVAMIHFRVVFEALLEAEQPPGRVLDLRHERADDR